MSATAAHATRTPRRHSVAASFVALLRRDLRVLVKNLKEFVPRTVIQPFMLVFIFTYVFPKIGQGIGGGGRGAATFSTLLVAGVVALSIVFQGIQSVALPLVQEFGYTKEIEDRVLAPIPVSLVAVEKIAAGALQSLVAALIVFPVAALVPATPVHLHFDWPVLVTLVPLACVMSSSLGLFFGTKVDPRSVPSLFGIIVLPLTFLGAVYYPWKALSPIPWLKWGVLVNPLVYMSEGFRAALTSGVPHMSLGAVYGALLGFTALLARLGISGFRRRVIA
ncbi:MAG: ABC transporter permease [Acidimicrobiales bacterium]